MSLDSQIYHMASKDIEKCVRPEMLSEFRKRKYEIFENPDATDTQAGLLKTEGLFQEGKL